jgi:hypothetical protein
MSKFICMWDCNGIESVIDITEYEFEEDTRLMEMIRTGKPVNKGGLGSLVQRLILRSRFNNQRHYEIYAIEATKGITDKDIFQMFDNDPQGSADLIRNRGVKIHSARATKSAAIV